MSLMEAEDSAGVYFFSGNPRNLVIWLELTFVGTAFGELPSFAERLADRNHRVFGQVAANANRRPIERAVFSWQQKVEKPRVSDAVTGTAEANEPTIDHEHEDPNDRSPPPSDPRHSERKNEEVDQKKERTKAEGRPPTVDHESRPFPQAISPSRSRLFTYVESELGSIIKNEDVGGSAGLFRARKVVPLSNSTIRHPVRKHPTREQQRKERQLTTSYTRMQIVGYFGPWNQSYDSTNEVVLCTIQLTGQRVLRVQPNLGKHHVDTRIGHYEFKVWIEPLAEFDTIPPANSEKFDIPDDESSVLNSIHEDQFKFELPEKGTILLAYLVVIEEAIDFPHDGICIEYELELAPSIMTPVSANQCSGRTQLCAIRSSGRMDIARFSFPIELALTYDLNADVETHAFRWPRLLFRVLAEDQWTRYYVDGYGSVSLPTTPTTGQKLLVECWRLVNPKSSLARLQENFIGQPIDLMATNSSTMKTGLTEAGRTYSKLEISSEGSGTILLSVNCMRQSRHYISQEVLRSLRYGRFIKSIGLNSNLYWRITKVLMQFEEAKRQLARIRKQPLPQPPQMNVT